MGRQAIAGKILMSEPNDLYDWLPNTGLLRSHLVAKPAGAKIPMPQPKLPFSLFWK